MRATFFFLLCCLQRIYPASSNDNNPFTNFRGLTQSDDDESNLKQIINGEEAVPGRYPFMVALVLNGEDKPYCGGSLIDPMWVLTAAHCQKSTNGTAFIGRHDFTDETEIYEEIQIEEQIVHPEYNDLLIGYDFMLIKLAEPSNSSIIELDDGAFQFEMLSPMTVMGWGVTQNRWRGSDYLQETVVNYIEQNWCDIIYALLGGVTESMMCARGWNTDACHGDSGGPLIIKGEDSSSDLLVGIVSWGLLCNLFIFPGVYARVPLGLDFIRSHVSSI